MGSLNPANFNASHIMDSFRGLVGENLPESSDSTYILLDSAPLFSITTLALKNYPYVSMGTKLGMDTLDHFFSSRCSYLEAALISIASTIHNVALFVFYTGLTLATLGLASQIRYGCKKHWRHTGHALASFGIALMGMVLPKLAFDAYLFYTRISYESLKKDFADDRKMFEKPLIKQIQNIYQKYHKQLEGFLRAQFGTMRYFIDIKPLKDKLGQNIQEAQGLDELVETIKASYKEFKEGHNAQNESLCNQCKRQIVYICNEPTTTVDLLPIMNSFMKVVDEDLTRFFRDSYILLDSSALCTTTLTTLKNLPFIAIGNKLGMDDLCHYISSRASYLETLLINLASTIYSIAFAIIYSSLLVLTLGLSDKINFATKKHLYQIYYGATFLGISLLGTLVPTIGAVANVGFLHFSIKGLQHELDQEQRSSQMRLLGRIKTLYEHYKTELDAFLYTTFSPKRYVTEFRPLKAKLDQGVKSAQGLEDLWDVSKSTYLEFIKDPSQSIPPICDHCLTLQH